MHWLAHIIGLDDAAGRWYLFWSGFGSDLAYFGAVGLLWRKFHCHAKGCWRVGLHRVANTHYVTCRHHHPVHDGKRPATAEQIEKAHRTASA